MLRHHVTSETDLIERMFRFYLYISVNAFVSTLIMIFPGGSTDRMPAFTHIWLRSRTFMLYKSTDMNFKLIVMNIAELRSYYAYLSACTFSTDVPNSR